MRLNASSNAFSNASLSVLLNVSMTRFFRGLVLAILCFTAHAQPGQVVASGTVPDEATRVLVLERLRELYGASNVVDQISVGGVVTPPQWSANLQKILHPGLKQVTRGELRVEGTQLSLKGDIANEAAKQTLVSNLANALNSTYTIKNGLRVVASEQTILDDTLANRIVEFEMGSATLTLAGRAVLDDVAATLKKMPGKRVEIIGHTDDRGARASNLVLSQARADAVKNYLLTKGLDAEYLSTSGAGPDRPLADNRSENGRARNRRIEFRVGS